MDKNVYSTAKKIIWLASYPKSGNTWLRAFITALNKGQVDINELDTDGIFSSRVIFDSHSGLDSSLLLDHEAKALQGKVFNYLSKKTNKKQLLIKAHDAYTFMPNGEPLIPTESTFSAIYLIRNPLDIAGSLANHLDSTIDEAIEMMNDDNCRFSIQNNNVNVKPQFEQRLLSWSGHVLSWTTKLPFPVLVLKYEDMLSDTQNVFRKAAMFMGINADGQQIKAAIASSSFEQLQQNESKHGFTEKSTENVFFRNGKAENWRNELTYPQINAIRYRHGPLMQFYGY